MRRWVPKFPQNMTAFDVVKESIVVVCLIRVSTIIHEDVFDLAATTFPLRSYANDIAGRGRRGLRGWVCLQDGV